MTNNIDYDEGVVSFDDDDDNDDMAELFSFGGSMESKKPNVDYKKVMASVMPKVPTKDDDGEDESNHSEDSFLDFLEQQNQEVTVVSSTQATKSNGDEKTNGTKTVAYDENDVQEILGWLDKDDDDDDEEEVCFVLPSKEDLPSLAELPKVDPLPPPPPEFKTLEEAVKSSKASIQQIRSLLEKENFVVAAKIRPHLWCRVVCGKTLEDTLQSSVADSFQQWEQQQSSSSSSSSSSLQSKKDSPYQQRLHKWISDEATALADRILVVPNINPQLCQKALTSILLNHYDTSKKHTQEEKETVGGDESESDSFKDPLLPTVACAILSAGIPKVAAAVMLSKIVPSFMPILALTIKERAEAANMLHRQFYLLACYHLPLLALHLDRFLPNWYHGPPNGLLPQSWLISHLAGECQGTMMNPKWLLCLWDLILTSSNNSLRFFLVMAILETHSDQLLLLTGDALREELCKVMQFKENITDGFAIEAEDETTTSQAARWVREWYDRAQAIWEATPISVIRVLKKLEDEAVCEALTKRQREAEERLQQKLQAEAKAHQDAMEAERERKSDEARLRLTRARLVAFYRTHNPGKESNIDKIMKNYEGRYDVLDAKLKQKYGVGFNPALKPKPANKNNNNSNNNNNLLATMHPGLVARAPRQFFGKRKDEESEFVIPDTDQREQTVVSVEASEVLPILCWSKEANAAKFARLEHEKEERADLKFFLVDSRPEAAARDQGRFPTSVSLSPQALLDPDRIKQQEEIFESLRGSAHICIMGEGYSALPDLYGNKMTQRLYEYIKEDETRNTLCALFFIKKGFPFVSVMEGGFAAAHSWLCREGPSKHLRVSNVLTDYNSQVSLFGQFESLYEEQQQMANATAKEKTQRALQGLFDSSMTALTKNSMRFGNLASDLETADGRSKVRKNVVNLFGSAEEDKASASEESNKPTNESGENGKAPQSSSNTTSPSFINPFARKNGQAKDGSPLLSKQASDKSLEVESVDFDNPSDTETSPGKNGPSESKHVLLANSKLEKSEHGRSSSDQVSASAEQAKNNPFAGLGAALNKSVKVNAGKLGASVPAAAKGLPRNPFARFGMNPNAKKNEGKKPETKGFGISNNLAGLNQFRKNTMAMMMMSGAQDGGELSHPATINTDVMEESVSLDASSPAIAASSEEHESMVQESNDAPVADSPTTVPSNVENPVNTAEHTPAQREASVAKV